MKETVIKDHQTQDQTKLSTLLTERLEQLGYECLTDSCEQFTTLRLMPTEIKRKDEKTSSSSE